MFHFFFLLNKMDVSFFLFLEKFKYDRNFGFRERSGRKTKMRRATYSHQHYQYIFLISILISRDWQRIGNCISTDWQ